MRALNAALAAAALAAISLVAGEAAAADDLRVAIVDLGDAREVVGLEHAVRARLEARGYDVLTDAETVLGAAHTGGPVQLPRFLRAVGADIAVGLQVEPSGRYGLARLRVTAVTADGRFERALARRGRRVDLPPLGAGLVDLLLEPAQGGVRVPGKNRAAVRVALWTATALSVQYLVPYAVLSTEERVGRRCPTCVAGAFAAYTVGAPAVSAAFATHVGQRAGYWAAPLWPILAGTYAGALLAYGAGFAVDWSNDEPALAFAAMGVAPVLMPAMGAFLGALVRQRPKVGARYLPSPHRARAVAWSPPAIAPLDAVGGGEGGLGLLFGGAF